MKPSQPRDARMALSPNQSSNEPSSCEVSFIESPCETQVIAVQKLAVHNRSCIDITGPLRDRVTMSGRRTGLFALLLAFIASVCVTTPAMAQPPKKKGLDLGGLSDALNVEVDEAPVSGLPSGLSAPLMKAAPSDAPISYTAEYTLAEGGKTGELRVTATLSGTWHTYSVTQPPGGPKPTVIKADSKLVKLSSAIESDQPPKISTTDVYPGVPIEEHAHSVAWKIPFEVVGDLAGGKTDLKVMIDALVCADPPLGECRPIDETITAKYLAPKTTGEVAPFRPKFAHTDVSVRLEPAELKAGGDATLIVTFEVEKPFHIYVYDPMATETANKTLMVPIEKGGLKWGKPTTSSVSHKAEIAGLEIEYYKDPRVEFRIPVRAPQDITSGEKEIKLGLGFQTCTDASCDPPTAAIATGTVKVVDSPVWTSRAGLQVADSTSREIASQSNLTSWIDFSDEPKTSVANAGDEATAPTVRQSISSLGWSTLLSALLGGFILNFMPCVLPVIGLKVLGFVEQAGSSRAEVIKLNLAYVLGICAVMWALAGVTVATQNAFGWGQQFTIFEFKLAMAGLVFAMALSFLGVWEIPIPGFATSYHSNKLMEREGVVGAFSKGLLTTILATPCSGPFLGFVFAVTLTLDPVGVFIIYTLVGLGMGLPFLVLCLRPSAVKLLPKPGVWMETLKEALAFPLLLTVVYFVASISDEYRIATFSTLIAVWFGCWMVGKVPIYADKHVKIKTWSAALASIAVWGMVSFYLLGPTKTNMPWQEFSPDRLSALRSSGKTVMIDFTANWCVNCKYNTMFAIEVPSVIDVVKKNGVVPLLADKTNPSPEIDEQIRKLGANAIPLLAIYPPDPDAEPIIFNATFTASQLVKALEQAGPSRPAGKLTNVKQE